MSLLNNNVIAIAILCIVLIFNDLLMSNAFGDLLPFGEITKMENFTLDQVKSTELVYFNVAGVAHPIRFLLAIRNIQFEDMVFNDSDWPNIKPKTPFHHVPLLIFNKNISLIQSGAICNYLATNTIYKTESIWDDYLVANYIDTFHDLRRDIRKFLYEKNKSISETKKNFFLANVLPIYMTKFNNIVKYNKGFFIDGKMSIVDIFFAGFAISISYYSGMDTLKNYEYLNTLQKHVFKVQNIEKWLKEHKTFTDYEYTPNLPN